eukprot:3510915-Amphidinium_carterae.2
MSAYTCTGERVDASLNSFDDFMRLSACLNDPCDIGHCLACCFVSQAIGEFFCDSLPLVAIGRQDLVLQLICASPCSALA